MKNTIKFKKFLHKLLHYNIKKKHYWWKEESGKEIVLTFRTVTQETCTHDAKVKMPGYKDRYECTRCHKFIVYDHKTS